MNLISNINPGHAELLMKSHGVSKQDNSIVVLRSSHDYSNELSDVIIGKEHERRHLEYGNPCLLQRPGTFWQMTSPESNIELRGSRKGLSSLVRKVERKIASNELIHNGSSDFYSGKLNVMDVDRFKAIIDGPDWQCYEVMDKVTAMPQLTEIMSKNYLENPKTDANGNIIYQALKSYFLHEETGTPLEVQVVPKDKFIENEKTHLQHKKKCFENEHSLMGPEGKVWGIYVFNESPEVDQAEFEIINGMAGVAYLINFPLEQKIYDSLEVDLSFSGSMAL